MPVHHGGKVGKAAKTLASKGGSKSVADFMSCHQTALMSCL